MMDVEDCTMRSYIMKKDIEKPLYGNTQNCPLRRLQINSESERHYFQPSLANDFIKIENTKVTRILNRFISTIEKFRYSSLMTTH